MLMLTVIYTGAVVYANTSSESYATDTVYAAILYEDEPTEWYYPGQLGITKILDYGVENATVVWVVVPHELDPGDLMVERPVFIYKDRFYQISDLHMTPGLPEHVKQWQAPVGGAIVIGWIFTGALFYKRRERE